MFKKPEDAAQMILSLLNDVEVQEVDGVKAVYCKIVSTDIFEQNVNNLAKVGEERVGIMELRMTLSWLWNTTVEDQRVAMLTRGAYRR